jgi:cytochrome c6
MVQGVDMINRKMLAINLLVGGLCLFVFSATTGLSLAATLQEGEVEFKQYCAACHSDGGNIINQDKTLSKADRDKNGIKTANDIIKIIRNPGVGMPLFDEKTLLEKDAGKIAKYILKSYN